MQVDGVPSNRTPFLVFENSWCICPQMMPLIFLCLSKTWNKASLFFNAIASIQALWILTGWWCRQIKTCLSQERSRAASRQDSSDADR